MYSPRSPGAVIAPLALLAIVSFAGADHAIEDPKVKTESPKASVRRDVIEWLPRVFKDPGEVDPASLYGDAVLPVVREVLSEPEGLTTHETHRALILVRLVDRPYPPLRSVLPPFLQAEEWQMRLRAVEALGAIGGSQDAPALVSMLYDPHHAVRYHAARALGKLGDESALLALAIWEKQVATADKRRALQEQWLTGSMAEAINKAKKAIRQRGRTGKIKGSGGKRR